MTKVAEEKKKAEEEKKIKEEEAKIEAERKKQEDLIKNRQNIIDAYFKKLRAKDLTKYVGQRAPKLAALTLKA